VRCVFASLSFAERVPQLSLGRIHFALGVLAEQYGSQFVALIIAGDKFLLRVRTVELDASWQDTEIADEVQFDIEYF
jgi:hypothetical protein